MFVSAINAPSGPQIATWVDTLPILTSPLCLSSSVESQEWQISIKKHDQYVGFDLTYQRSTMICTPRLDKSACKSACRIWIKTIIYIGLNYALSTFILQLICLLGDSISPTKRHWQQQSQGLVTFETLITTLTIENPISWLSNEPDQICFLDNLTKHIPHNTVHNCEMNQILFTKNKRLTHPKEAI